MTEIASIVSMVVAIVALFVAFRVERRNQLRFDDQLKQSRKFAIANMKPLITIQSQIYINRKGITLSNFGVGTAVITNIEFEKGGYSTRSLVELFDLGTEFMWDTFWKFSGDKYYIPANGRRQLVELTSKNLVKQEWSEDEAIALLAKWQAQKAGINVRIEYEDLIGNTLEPYITTLR